MDSRTCTGLFSTQTCILSGGRAGFSDACVNGRYRSTAPNEVAVDCSALWATASRNPVIRSGAHRTPESKP